MAELANGMWKFHAKGSRCSSIVYLRVDEIVGAIVDDASASFPQLVLLTLHSGAISIDWVAHHTEIVDYIEGVDNAREADEEP